MKTELVKVFYKTNVSIFKNGITEDKCIFLILQEKLKRQTSGYPHVVVK